MFSSARPSLGTTWDKTSKWPRIELPRSVEHCMSRSWGTWKMGRSIRHVVVINARDKHWMKSCVKVQRCGHYKSLSKISVLGFALCRQIVNLGRQAAARCPNRPVSFTVNLSKSWIVIRDIASIMPFMVMKSDEWRLTNDQRCDWRVTSDDQRRYIF